MKILIVSVVFPFPVDAGGSAGTYKMIDYARKEHDITFLSLATNQENLDQLRTLWPNVDIRTAQQHQEAPEPSLLRRIANFVRGNNSAINDRKKKNMILYGTDLDMCYFPEIIDLLQDTLKEKTFDLIQTEYIDFAPLVHFLPEGIPKVHVHHELRFRRMQLEYDLQEVKDHADKWHIETTKTLEVNTLKLYDRVLTVSQNDANILVDNGLAPEKVSSSPLPVEPLRDNVKLPFKFKNKLVYLGPQVHYPNYDAVTWFLGNIWPNVSEANENIEFQVIGKWPQEFIEQFKNLRNVSFLGFVDNLSQAMEGAIMVVPLRIGGGMRMKILEAISWQIPVITTTAGAEGLPMVSGENCLIANTPNEIANAIKNLCSSEKMQNDFISAASPILKSNFSIEKCGSLRNQLYLEIKGQKA